MMLAVCGWCGVVVFCRGTTRSSVIFLGQPNCASDARRHWQQYFQRNPVKESLLALTYNGQRRLRDMYVLIIMGVGQLDGGAYIEIGRQTLQRFQTGGPCTDHEYFCDLGPHKSWGNEFACSPYFWIRESKENIETLLVSLFGRII